MERNKLSEELKHCLNGDDCGECAYSEENFTLSCIPLLQSSYEKIKGYEDLEEQGLLLKLPCSNWMDIVFGEQKVFWGIDKSYIENPIREITVDNSERFTWYDGWKTVILKGADENGLDWEFSPEEIGKTVFFTQAEAEEALKKVNETEE